MSGENLGTANLTLSVDTETWDASLARAEGKYSQMSAVVQGEAQKMTVGQQKMLVTAQRQINMLGLTQSERMKLTNLEKFGVKVGGELNRMIDERTAALNRQAGAANKAELARNKYGITDKQQIAAMRQVPAQMTDIFVSLQGGQNPMTVLMQQGGQLKDIFGGIVPAAKALGSQMLALINPITAVVAGVAAIAYSFANAESEQSKLQQSLAITNNYVNTTTTKLTEMGIRLGEMANVSVSGAIDTISKVVGSGRFVAEEIESVAIAAEKMRVSTGQSVEDTIKIFSDLKGDPVGAILKLNETQHFLTQSTYDQIKALVEQGDTFAAGQLAADAYTDHIDRATGRIEENIGYLRQFARAVKELWAGVIEAVDGIGRTVSNGQRIADLRANIAALEKAKVANDSFWGSMNSNYGHLSDRQLDASIAKQRAEITRLSLFDSVTSGAASPTTVTSETIRAQEKYAATTRQLQSETVQHELKVKKIRAEGKAAGIEQSKIDADVALADAKFAADQAKKNKRGGGRGAARLANAESKAELDAIKAAYDVQRNEIQNNEKLLQASYQARLISQADYYAKSRENMTANFKAEESSLQQQIGVLRARNVTGADAAKVSGELATLEAKLAKARADHTVAMQIQAIQEADFYKQREYALKDFERAITDQVDATKRGNQAQLESMYLSAKEHAIKQQIVAITERETDALRKLNDERDRGNLQPGEYERKRSAIQDGARAERDAVIDGYNQMDMAQQDWVAGAKRGLQDWVDANSDANTQIRNLTMQTMDRIADGFVELALTGKMQWRQMLADILKEITKFLMKQAILKFVEVFADAWMGRGRAGGAGGGTNPTIGPYMANGGAWGDGVQLFGNGGVVNSPTPFAHRGGIGVAGEAGPEGILPLKRGPSGKLGVQMYGGGGIGGVNISITNVIGSNGNTQTSMTSSNSEQLLTQLAKNQSDSARKEIMLATMPNGILWKLGVRAS